MLVSHNHRLVRAALATILGSGWFATPAVRAAVIMAPPYDFTTQTGYQSITSMSTPIGTPGGGAMVAGSVTKYVSGVQQSFGGVRVDASGNTIDLQNFSPEFIFASAVNAAGTVVGNANLSVTGDPAGGRAVRWDASGAITELGNLGVSGYNGATVCDALGINAAGTTVGHAEKYVSGNYMGDRAVRWDASVTAATEFAGLGIRSDGYNSSFAYAINSAGMTVGQATKWSGDTNLGYRAVRWNGLIATELGNLGTDSSGVTTSGATAINDAGTAVGSANKYLAGASKGQRAVRWDAGGTAAAELGNLGTDSNGRAFNEVTAINATGITVGDAEKYVGGVNKARRAVRWDAGATAATELANLGTDASGRTFSIAYGINAAGIAVGRADTVGANAGSRAVAWGQDGLAIDLNTLLAPDSGWLLEYAYGITDTNWASGYGYFDPDGPAGQDGVGRMFLLDISSIVPEPGTFGLIAFSGITLLHRRRTTA